MKEGNPRHEVQKVISFSFCFFCFFFCFEKSLISWPKHFNTVISNNQLQRKQKQYSTECAMFLHRGERKKF